MHLKRAVIKVELCKKLWICKVFLDNFYLILYTEALIFDEGLFSRPGS